MQQTPNLHTIINYACEEAGRLGNTEILPDHMMLGILRLGAGKAFELLMQAGMDPVELKRKIDERLLQDAPTQTNKLSRASERIIRLTGIEARTYQAETCGSVHLMMALLRDRINFPAMYLEQQHGIDYECMERLYPKPDPLPQGELTMDEDKPERETTIHIFGTELGGEKKQKGKTDTPALTKYGRDLTAQAKNGELDPVIGRAIEIDRVTQILSRRKKNNPILIGEPGVGKSAIVEGLALRIVNNEIPALQNKRIISLDIASMVAGTTYRGQFEERIKTVIKELNQHPEVILFIDEIHTLMGAGNAQGSLDAANILKPALARGEVQCIGATTVNEYRTSIEKDGALERRFQKVTVQPTTTDETYTILTRLSETYGQFHHVRYTQEALRACVNLTDRYITDRYFPDKAIDAMDEAGACKAESRKVKADNAETKSEEYVEITEADIARVVSQMSGVPVQRVAQAEGEQLRQMAAKLQQRVIGQDDAVQKVVKAIQRSRMGLRDPRKPIGTFFLLGPTGVGKTHLAQCLAEEMFGSRDAIIRFDMSEYMEKHTVSLLVGAPPGYVAHEDGGKLTEAVRRKPYSIVLFDEIEKAHPDIFNVLLQVMDEGRLTDRQGHIVNFKNTIIILTSNVGTRQLSEFGSGIGFGADSLDDKATERMLNKALQRTFPPEFVNRLDNIIVFHPLKDEDLAQILSQELRPLQVRLETMGYTLELTDATREEILRLSRDRQYGARPLKRAIQTLIEDPLTDKLLAGEIENKLIKI